MSIYIISFTLLTLFVLRIFFSIAYLYRVCNVFNQSAEKDIKI